MPWSEFPIVPSYLHYPQGEGQGLAPDPRPRFSTSGTLRLSDVRISDFWVSGDGISGVRVTGVGLWVAGCQILSTPAGSQACVLSRKTAENAEKIG